jgi:hypothetical protein
MANNSQSKSLDLASLFNVATQALTANQASLNQADTYNQNHGDNMVQAFSMITQALAGQQNSSPSQQLNHASEYLAQNGKSGSAHVYSQGLAQAARQFQGQSAVTPENAMTLIQSLLGGGQQPQQPQQPAQQAGGNLLGALLGGGGQQSGAADLLGSLLGGGQPAQQGSGQGQDNGLDLGDLLNAGMTFMNAKQQGQGNLQAGLSALMAAGPMAQSSHRQQSGQLVGSALLQAIAGMAK